MKNLCLLAQKGGTGKTTLCLHLAVLATELGKAVQVFDIDPQGSARAWRRRRQQTSPEVVTATAANLPGLLQQAAENRTDLALIDTAPHSTDEAQSAIEQADLVLIASRPAILDLEAIGASVKIVKQTGRPAAVVLNACPPPKHGHETAIVREAREALRVYQLPIAPVSISQRAAFSHALIDGRAVTEYEDQSKAADEVRSLWAWIQREMQP